ncbi:MAG: HAMP domain-containing sensor histidine kinase [Oscillospiraceae bacterium]|nr:HAMP domain-containing sensor histidine kinase [Oscillospiraceae bacterium]
MHKTLFKKYLSVISVIILISFVCMGTIMVVFVSRYWHMEQRNLLLQNAQGVANVATKSLLNEKDNTFTIDGERMEEFVSAFSENINACILVTDINGKIVMCHNSIQLNANESDAKQPSLDKALVNQVIRDGQYYGTTDLGGYFAEDYCVVGVPIVVTSENGIQTTIGTTFAASSLAFVTGFRAEVVKMFFLAGIAAFLVAFGVTWLYSYKMTRPLRSMCEATKSFAMGDFSVRVPVFSDDEIGELAKAFNQMAETLASSESMNRNFIANVSHELKTPMTTISGFIDGIIDGTIPPEKQNYYLGIVSQEVKRLSRLVKTMLDLSRIDSGKMVLRSARFDISNTIFVALLSFESQIEEKKIEIRGLEDCEPIFVNGDPDMIHQVLYNLLENAVKFTNEGGYIEIHALETPERVTVSIRNSGPGIPPDDVKMIFDRFYKTDKSRSQDKNGMGLGLYIVKTMVQLHGGEIRAESVENDYTLFEFWIPNTGDKGDKKKTVKTIIKNKAEKPGTVEVVESIERIEGEPVDKVPEAVEIVDVTDSAVETSPDAARKREGKKGK